MRYKNTGQMRLAYHRILPDSNAYDARYTALTENNSITRIVDGYIVAPQPEPLWEQGLVTVRLSRGGILGNVPYPGAHVSASVAGLPSPQISMIHGLYEAPLPGQHVVLGFVEGNAQAPIVLNKYPYNPTPNPIFASAFFLPHTRLGIGITDVVLGHHTGSMIALRGTLPLPGSIEIDATTTVGITSKAGVQVKTLATVTVEGIKVDISDNITGMNKISVSGVKIEITSMPGGMINIIPGAGGMLRLGKAPVAFCNNFPVCLFTGAPHSTSTDVMV